MPQDGGTIFIIFSLAVLLMSVIVHEVSHGYVAWMLGDPTAKLSGRLTLNPTSHLDPIGSVIVPVITWSIGIPFGWAKPVPYNPYNLKAGKWGPAIVAAAGPLSNFALALLFGLGLRLSFILGITVSSTVIQAVFIVLFINLSLGIFNLLPIAPLDGSKLLFALLPYHLNYIEEFMVRNQFLLVLALILVMNSSVAVWLIIFENTLINLILGI